jgi:hypothetical protein
MVLTGLSGVAPSRKVTVPVALAGRVAVNVTVAPYVAGLRLLVRTSDVVPALLTTCASLAELAAEKLVSPAYCATTLWVPTVRVEMGGRTAVPELAATVPRVVLVVVS